ncbi:uncharacterized protein GGS22DRAFT_156776 [Annulohypoxylon maeteangense]|uniref:uncharacterized protein n=1 Tax=Annulohypoxylon maeteangense TaxID=1927788 RepID=UPI0020075CBB|nr:uncharacterized protein GGS22DRAFT_156776 [Annulohypoxylon maeteangense]KAI0887327.1 hypothetical protein GGS22DRAFT_156776 [Annulohypoxylon maeteangense]
MQWLPSQRNRHRQNEPQPHSLLDEYFPPSPIPEANDYLTCTPNTICPTSPQEDLTTLRRHPSPLTPNFGTLANSTIKTIKGPSFILDEPLMRPSSRITHSKSNSSKSAKGDPFTTTSPDTFPPRTQSPYAPRRPSPLATHAEVAETNSGGIAKSWKARLRRSPSPLAEHLRRYVRRTPPAQSSEFINLYRPLQPLNPGVAVPGRLMGRDVGDGRPVRRMLGRLRTPSPRTEGDGQVVMGTGEVVDAKSVRKRSSLQNEIRKLFAGRGQG